MSNKQSSVEWLIDRITQDQLHRDISHKVWIEIFEKAKAMHKEEMMQSLNDGKAMALGSIENLSLEQYYNETFNTINKETNENTN